MNPQLSFLASTSEHGGVSLREFARQADQKARGSLFDGATLDERDVPRLTRQLDRVKQALATGRWWTLAALAEEAGGSEAGVSARLRDLRKLKHGGHTIERRRREDGVYEYRRGVPEKGKQAA